MTTFICPPTYEKKEAEFHAFVKYLRHDSTFLERAAVITGLNNILNVSFRPKFGNAFNFRKAEAAEQKLYLDSLEAWIVGSAERDYLVTLGEEVFVRWIDFLMSGDEPRILRVSDEMQRFRNAVGSEIERAGSLTGRSISIVARCIDRWRVRAVPRFRRRILFREWCQ